MARHSTTGKNVVGAKALNTRPAKASNKSKASPRTAPVGNPRKRFSVSNLQHELERRNEELNEAREQQAATAEILKVINARPGDLTPVFDVILEKAHNLCDVPCGSLQLFNHDHTRAVAVRGMTEAFEKILRQGYRLDRSQPVQSVRPFQIDDLAKVPRDGSAPRVAYEMGGLRTMLSVPLVRDGVAFGRIVAGRPKVRPFSEHQIAVLQSFADQAVIAIENARLFNETKEALERQTATADILKVIASSPSNVQPVFEAIAISAKRLIGGFSSSVFRFVDGIAHLAAFTPTNAAADQVLKDTFPRAVAEFQPFELAQAGNVVQVPDTEAHPDGRMKEVARARGFRSVLNAPLMTKRTPIGGITATRKEPGTFPEHHFRLLQTFADQAVIAIENVRLFDEVQAKTRDLTEALTYQTASSNILGVIASSPTDVGPALQAIVESACKLCEAYDATVLLKIGTDLHFSAHHGPIPTAQRPRPISRQWVTGRAVVDKVPVQVPDFQSSEAAEFPEGQRQSREQGHRCALALPLLREGETIGALALRLLEPSAFDQRQISLLQSFGDQAVIAIGNVRLFDEVQAKTRDLTESLQQQTATAEVLKVISRSAFDLQTLLDTLVESAARLCEADSAALHRPRGDAYPFVASYGYTPEYIRYMHDHPLGLTRGSVLGRAVLEGKTVQVVDVNADTEYDNVEQRTRGDYRTVVGVPLMREGVPIGIIMLTRKAVRRFTDKQIELVTTFADQAVIAIENVRLFDQLQAKTRDLSEALTYQTGSGNILRVIASSPTEVGPVLKAIVESACELCDAYDAVLRLKNGGNLELGAHHGTVPADWNLSRINNYWTAGRSVLDRRAIQVSDMLSSEGDEFPEGREHGLLISARLQRRPRTILSVPLLREGESIGAITLRRTEVHRFSENQISLLRTFADQAVIAIGNVRLFDEVQARTRDLTESLEQQTGSANILKVIASSPTDVDPVLSAIAESACELCDAYDAVVVLKRGEELSAEAHYGDVPLNRTRWLDDRSTISGRAIADRVPIHIHDVSTAGSDLATAKQMS